MNDSSEFPRLRLLCLGFALLFFLLIPVTGLAQAPGAFLWGFGAPGIQSPPAIGPDGTLYFCTGHGDLHAVTPAGIEKWRRKLPMSVYTGSAVVGVDGTLYVGSVDHRVHAFTPEGVPKWSATSSIPSLPSDAPVSVMAVTDGGTLYVTGNGRVWSLRSSDQTEQWNLRLSARNLAVAPDHTLYTLTDVTFSTLGADGNQRWSLTDEQFSAAHAPAIASDGTVVLAFPTWPTNSVRAFSPAGIEKWRYELSRQDSVSAPVVGADGAVYFGSGYTLHALNADGTLRWRASGDRVTSSAALAQDGTIYFASWDELTALNGDGRLLWRTFLTNGILFGPQLAADGTIYVTTGDAVLAVKGSSGPATNAWAMERGNARRSASLARVAALPAAPANLQASTGTFSSVRVGWTSVPGAAGYEVWRGTSGEQASATRLDSVSGRTVHSDRTAVADRQYFYWVRALNEAGAGPFAGPVSGFARVSQRGDITWAFSAGGAITLHPAVDSAGNIYFADSTPAIHALSATGQRKWTRPITDPLAAPLVIGPEGNLYSVSQGGDLTALALETGAFQWNVKFSSETGTAASLAVAGNGVLYLRHDSSPSGAALSCFTPDGVQRWRQTLAFNRGTGLLPLAIGVDGAVYTFATADLTAGPRLVALNPDGSQRWARPYGSIWDLPGPIFIGQDLMIYTAPGGSSTTISVTTSAGLERPDIVVPIEWDGRGWQSDYDWRRFKFAHSPVVGPDGTLYVSTISSNLVSMSATGATNWRYSAEAPGVAAPTLAQDGTILFSTASTIHALARDGKRLWSTPQEDEIQTAPALGPDGTAYVGTLQGRLLAISLGSPAADTLWPMPLRDARNSANLSGPLPPPVNLPVLTVSTGAFPFVRLQWASVTNAMSYEIWRATGTNLAESVRIAESVSGAAPFDDTAVSPGMSYTYWARAWNPAGSTPFSLPATGSARPFAAGDELWQKPLPDLTSMTVAEDGTLYANVGTDLRAIAPDGAEKWRLANVGRPAVGPDRNLYASCGTNLCAFSSAGLKIWEVPGIAANSIPSVGPDGTIYVLDLSGYLRALSPEGRVLWGMEIAGLNGVPALGADGSVYLRNGSGQLTAIDRTGSVLWSAVPTGSQPAIGPDGTIYLLADTRLHALNTDGSIRWASGRLGDSPAVNVTLGADGAVHVASIGALRSFSSDGTLEWTLTSPGSFSAVPPLVGDGGLVYAPIRDGHFAAISRGQVLWSANTSALSHIHALGNGRVFVYGQNGILRAIQAEVSVERSPWPTALGSPRNTLSLAAPFTAAPDRSALVSAQSVPNAVRLTWNSAARATTYELWRGDTPDLTAATRIVDRMGGQLVFDDITATVGATHWYWLRAQNPIGFSAFSEPVSGRARAAVSGEARWKIHLGGPITQGPVVTPDGTIIAGSQGRISAISPQGRKLWVSQTRGYQGPLVVAPNGNILTFSGQTVCALNSDGTERWRHPVRANPYWQLVVAPDGTILVLRAQGGFPNHADTYLRAINPDGTLKWEVKAGDTEGEALIVAGDGRVYLTLRATYQQGALTSPAQLAAVNPDGTLAWNVPLGTDATGPLAMSSEGRLYAPAENGRLGIYDRNGSRQGTISGTFNDRVFNFTAYQNIALSGDGALLAREGQTLIALNPDGTRRWIAGVPDHIHASPVVGPENMTYVVARRTVFGFQPAGRRSWSYQAGMDLTSELAIANDGTLLVGDQAGFLHSVVTEVSGPAPWAMPKNDARNSGVSTVELPIPPAPTSVTATRGTLPRAVRVNWPSAPPASSYEIWRSSVDDSASALLVGIAPHGTLYLDTNVVAGASYHYWVKGRNVAGASGFSLSTTGSARELIPGDPIAQFEFGGASWSSTGTPTVGPDGAVYVASADRLYCLNPDLSKRWEFRFSGGISSRSAPAMAPDGTLYLMAGARSLYAINPDGTQKWEFLSEQSGYGSTSPSIGDDGTIYAGFPDGFFYAVRPDGTEKWRVVTGGRIESSPAIGPDGAIYFGTSDERFYALNADGSRRWVVHTRVQGYSSPSIAADGTIYFTAVSRFFALNPDGSTRWSIADDFGSASPAIGGDGTIYVGNSTGSLRALNPNGSRKWALNGSGSISGSPVVGADGTVFVRYHSGRVVAVSPEGRRLGSSGSVSEGETSPAIGTNGTIYVTSYGQFSRIQALLGTTNIGGGPWPTFRRDLRHTANTASLPTTAPEIPQNLTLSSPTNYPLRVSWFSSPTALSYSVYRNTTDQFDGAVVLASSLTGTTNFADYSAVAGTNYFYWVKARNGVGESELTLSAQGSTREPQVGEILWAFQTGADIHSSPAVGSDGTVYFGSWDGKFYALHRNGNLKWSYVANAAIEASPLLMENGTVVFGTTGGTIHALSPEGEPQWKFQASKPIETAGAVSPNGTLYFTTGRRRPGYWGDPSEGEVMALTSTGTNLWRKPLGYASAPAVAPDGSVYLLDSNQILSFDPDGNQLWNYNSNVWWSGNSIAGIALGKDGVVLIPGGSRLLALHSTGHQQWSFSPGSGFFAPPVVGPDGTVYACNTDNALVARTAAGRWKWTRTIGSPVVTAPALAADGTIYVTTTDGRLVAFDNAGNRLRTLTVGSPIRSSPAIGDDGTIYFGSADGKLYAIKGSSPLAAGIWPMFQRDLRHSGSGFDLEFSMPVVDREGDLKLPLFLEKRRDYSIEISEDMVLWAPLTNFHSINGVFELKWPTKENQPPTFFRAVLH